MFLQDFKNKITIILFVYYILSQFFHGFLVFYDITFSPGVFSVIGVLFKQTIAICMSWCILAYEDILDQPDKLNKKWIFAIFFKLTPVNRIKRFRLDCKQKADSFIDQFFLVLFRLIKSLYLTHQILIILIFIRLKNVVHMDLISMVCSAYSMHVVIN